MNSEKISIVVPVYNVEQYIDQCITSLIGQSYTNLEIILVDDGSSDQSGIICDEYALKDSRINVFHIKNSGQSTARNIGIDNATGEYISFVDSDDYIDTDMYLKMIETAIEKDAQIVECNFEGRHIKAPEQDVIQKYDYIELPGEEALTRQLDYRIESQYPGTALWPKMFRKDVIGDMRLPDGCIHEEFALLASAFLKAEKYVYICETMYHRTIRDNSTTAMLFSDRAFDKLTVYRMRNELLKEMNKGVLYRYSKEQEYIMMLHFYGQACVTGLDDRVKQMREELLLMKYEILNSNLDSKKMMKFKLFYTVPKIYGFLYRIKEG